MRKLLTAVQSMLVGFALGVQAVVQRGTENIQKTFEGELEPEPVRKPDEWDRWMHHTDVTEEEQAMLYSGDPLQVHKAREQIEYREMEFAQFWADKDKVRELALKPYLDEVSQGKQPTPMSEKEGWEDDADLPDVFYRRNEMTGALEEIRFADCPEWQNASPSNEPLHVEATRGLGK